MTRAPLSLAAGMHALSLSRTQLRHCAGATWCAGASPDDAPESSADAIADCSVLRCFDAFSSKFQENPHFPGLVFPTPAAAPGAARHQAHHRAVCGPARGSRRELIQILNIFFCPNEVFRHFHSHTIKVRLLRDLSIKSQTRWYGISQNPRPDWRLEKKSQTKNHRSDFGLRLLSVQHQFGAEGAEKF